MDIKGNDWEIRLLVNKAIDVDIAYDEAGGATAGVLVNPLQVLGYGDGRTAYAMEHRYLMSISGKRELVIPCDQTLEGIGEHGEDSRQLRLGRAFISLLLLLDPESPVLRGRPLSANPGLHQARSLKARIAIKSRGQETRKPDHSKIGLRFDRVSLQPPLQAKKIICYKEL